MTPREAQLAEALRTSQVKVMSIRDLLHITRGYEAVDNRRINAIHLLATELADGFTDALAGEEPRT